MLADLIYTKGTFFFTYTKVKQTDNLRYLHISLEKIKSGIWEIPRWAIITAYDLDLSAGLWADKITTLIAIDIITFFFI